MTDIRALVKQQDRSSASDANASSMQKQRGWIPVGCMGSRSDRHVKCCQVDALARQHASALEHAIWARHVEARCSRLGRVRPAAAPLEMASKLYAEDALCGCTTLYGRKVGD